MFWVKTLSLFSHTPRPLCNINLKKAYRFQKIFLSTNAIMETEFDLVKEGKGEILISKDQKSVFYNPVQEFNRDLTIAVISEFTKEYLEKKNINVREFSKEDLNVVHLSESDEESSAKPQFTNVYQGEKCDEGIRILEALSASGLRSMRFAKELAGVKQIVANDLSEQAFESIKRNIAHNKVEDIIEPHHSDATLLMYQCREKENAFDVVDIDPYGSAANFLDSAVQAVKHGGLLCVTCTDMAVLAGKYPETCWAKYQSVPLVTKAMHEQALRILLASISITAARYSLYIEPLISVSIDFYVRVFLRVHYSPGKTKEVAGKHITTYNCAGCGSYYYQSIIKNVPKKKVFHAAAGPPVSGSCEHCGHNHRVGGPIWGAPLHDTNFVTRVISSVKRFPNKFGTAKRIEGILSMISEELPDVPLFYVTDEISKVLKSCAPPLNLVRSGLMNAGYRVSLSHTRKSSIKTDAPPGVLWDIMRKWIESNPINIDKLPVDSPARAILQKPITTEVDLTLRQDTTPKSSGLVRFPDMPKFWGPKSRARINVDGEIHIDETLQDRSKRFQGKRTRNLPQNETKITKQARIDNKDLKLHSK